MKKENRLPKNFGKNFKRLLAYFKSSKALIAIIVSCTIITAVCSVLSVSLVQPLIDDYIMPQVGLSNPDLTSLYRFILIIASVYLVSVVSSFLSARLLVNLSTGIMRNVRMEMFSKMQKLPLNL